MAKKSKKQEQQERYMKLAALSAVAVGFVVLAYLMGVQHTLTALQGSLPF